MATRDEILIESGPGEVRIARLIDGDLAELDVVRPESGDDATARAGDLFLGRVRKVVAGLEAAFVDIGEARDGFLGLADARPLGAEGGRMADVVSEGDAVLVQVLRAATEGKGAKLTTRPSLPGQALVLLPHEPEVRLSKKLKRATRILLEPLLEGMMADGLTGGGGLILRTGFADAGPAALAREAEALAARWRTIEAAARTAAAPVCLHRDDAVERVLRNAWKPGVPVTVDGADALLAARAHGERVAPRLLKDLHRHPGPVPLFTRVEGAIEAALAPVVPLPGGGSMVIEETAALVAVDVNTGALPARGRPEDLALAANLEAAEALGRQARLRRLGGKILVDAVPLKGKDKRARVLAALRGAFADDPDQVQVAGYTAMGLIEITRRRTGPSLGELLGQRCPACDGAGRRLSDRTRALAALRALEREARAHPGRGLVLRAAGGIVAWLEADGAALAAARDRLGTPLRLAADEALEGWRIDPEARA